MKDQILKIAKVKNEAEFYRKFPTEEAFMKAHKKEFKKAAMGASMVKKQLSQLTDFGNPPEAQNGMAFGDLLANANATNAGVSRKQYDVQNQQALDAQNAQASTNSKNPMSQIGQLGDLVNNFANTQSTNSKLNSAGMQLGDIMSGTFKRGGHLPIAQGGFDFSGLAKVIGGTTQKQGGLGSALANATGVGGGADSITSNATSSLGGGAAAAGMGVLNAAPDILNGISQIKQQGQNIKKADQMAQISGLTAQAAESRPEKIQNKYVRPEDSLVTGLSPQGRGYNPLAQYGAQIGGNPTEIQNTYNPGDLYNDLGYEPLNDSNVKQYRRGGNIPTAEFGEYFQNSGQASIGKGVGSAIGSAFFGPVGSMVGGLLGTAAGNLLGGVDDARKLQGFQDQTQANTQKAAWAAGAQSMQAQNKAFMEDGGWVSNDWQPQTITTFGEHNLKDLLKPPHDADMLRAGGHLKNYTPPSEEAMQTYAMGGDLKTHWGGYAEPLSQNPNLPDGGQTVMFRGQSHDDTNGKGQSGIGVTYGNNPVEVERGEPAVKLQDGGNPDGNLVVFGDMYIPKYGVSEIGDEKANGKKFKNYIADISKNDKKQSKIITKATELVNGADTNDPFDKLSMNAGQAMLMGATAKQKINADKINAAASIQNAILDTAKEHGLISADLAKGVITKDKKGDGMAKYGKKLDKAQSGTKKKFIDSNPPYLPLDYNSNVGNQIVQRALGNNYPLPTVNDGQPPIVPPLLPTGSYPYIPRVNTADPSTYAPITAIDQPVNVDNTLNNQMPVSHAWDITPKEFKMAKTSKDKKFDWADLSKSLMSNIAPLLRPTNQEPLDPNQLMGEQFALAHNQVEPVKAQQYSPMGMVGPQKYYLGDQVNAITSQARAAIRAAGNNPAAQAQIMAQASDQINKVKGEEFRMNQASESETFNKNRDLWNQAQLQNLGIMDQQYVRQATAKSNTKSEALAALNSISAKIAENKLENRKLGVMENMYNFRFDDKNRAYNVNDPYSFNTPTVGSGVTSTDAIGTSKSNLSEYERIKEDTKAPKKKNGGNVISRNGSIVKALKTL